jgi:hypothetical protein
MTYTERAVPSDFSRRGNVQLGTSANRSLSVIWRTIECVINPRSLSTIFLDLIDSCSIKSRWWFCPYLGNCVEGKDSIIHFSWPTREEQSHLNLSATGEMCDQSMKFVNNLYQLDSPLIKARLYFCSYLGNCVQGKDGILFHPCYWSIFHNLHERRSYIWIQLSRWSATGHEHKSAQIDHCQKSEEQ